jgi:hypothetical protein
VSSGGGAVVDERLALLLLGVGVVQGERLALLLPCVGVEQQGERLALLLSIAVERLALSVAVERLALSVAVERLALSVAVERLALLLSVASERLALLLSAASERLALLLLGVGVVHGDRHRRRQTLASKHGSAGCLTSSSGANVGLLGVDDLVASSVGDFNLVHAGVVCQLGNSILAKTMVCLILPIRVSGFTTDVLRRFPTVVGPTGRFGLNRTSSMGGLALA